MCKNEGKSNYCTERDGMDANTGLAEDSMTYSVTSMQT